MSNRQLPKADQPGNAVRSRASFNFVFSAVLLAGGLMTAGLRAAEGPIVLRDVTAQSGVTFVHTDGGSGRHYIAETVCSGLATFDYDGDGLIDIYFLNGRPLRGTPVREPVRNALYRNLGGWRFADVTEVAGVGVAV